MKPELFYKLSAPIYSIAMIVSVFASQMDCFAKPTIESSSSFGYHALKINNRFVDQEIFLEERNRFFMRWRTNSEMMYKGDEERMDLLLEDIIDRVIVEDFLLNRSGITITSEETDIYINQHIKPQYPSPEEFASFLHAQGYENENDLRKAIELYLVRSTYFVKFAKEAGLTFPKQELDSLFRKHVEDNRLAETRQIVIADLDSINSQELVLDLYRQCLNGADFSTLAAKYSSDESARSAGGLNRLMSRSDFDSVTANRIFSAQSGEVLPPIKHGFNYLLVKVEKFISTSHPEAEFTDMLLLKRFGDSELYKKWITELKSKTTITITDPALKTYRLFRSGQYNKAGALYEKLYRKHHDEYHLKRAIESFEKAGKVAKQIRLAQTGIATYPENLTYPLIKAECLYRQGQTSEARTLLQEIELRSQDNVYFTDLLDKTRAKLGIDK
ncbi:MAG TPA: peptidylprolyl isomerase [Chitinispirillaceae bacterium]|nr:peptidylprolyl isomerase [Chitinispirillaceae bacterium]